MKNIKFLVISLAILVISSIYLTKPAMAATRLSGISVQSACDHQYSPTPGTTLTATLGGRTVLNWYCVFKLKGKYILSTLSVDLSRECRRIYGQSAYAAYPDYWNAFSWGCYR